jgi:heme/copper-type cytochrome/quinol oxidase subunit 4
MCPSSPKNDKKEPSTMGQKLLGFCLAVLLSVILLYLAVELLARFWGWLVLVAAVVLVLWITIVIYRWRRDRW